jgi:RimJ/RimL family protein N-acetyltransferase
VTAAAPPVPLPDPPLVGGGLVLRPWAEADAPALAEAWADPEVARWTGVPPAADELAARRWIRGDADRRARGLSLDLVIDRSGAVAGEVGLAAFDPGSGTAEIGWWIAPRHRGAGSAGRAARLVATWAVDELALVAVVARCHEGNPASARVARAAGFERAGCDGPIEVWRFASPPPTAATIGP